MKFKNLKNEDIKLIKLMYSSNSKRSEVQEELSNLFNVSERTVRKWAENLGIGVMAKNVVNPAKILIYDIETPRLKFWGWWSGNRYVNGNDLVGDSPAIISISWKWLGEDKVHAAHWDLETQCDKGMMEEFLPHYNEADVVVGINNDKFDNRWINARAIFHRLDVNHFVRSIDVQKQAKRLLRLPSYSLKFLGRFFKLPAQKLNHEGLIMWEMIQEGTMEERVEYMGKMIKYNVGDIIATEAVYIRMMPMLNPVAHLGVQYGQPKSSCPHCGQIDTVAHHKNTITAAGTVQHIMKCTADGQKFKINNSEYIKWFNS